MQTKMIRYIEKFTFNQNIFFLGSVSQKERDILMKNAALTVIPSRNEAMSMVALETSLMGTPFLATKFCGLDDFEKNNSGYICNGDAKSITNELDKLLKDINSINEVGSNAQKYVLSFYSWESIIEKINYYLKKLINN
jgi:glycosyltransferase involved in cell wall biosynthesis